MREKRLDISIYRGPVLPALREIPHSRVLIPHSRSGAARVVALGEDDTIKRRQSDTFRIPHANLVKVTESGYLYLYHTVNPELGYDLDLEGRLQLLD